MASYPFTYEDLDEDTNGNIKKMFPGFSDGGLMKVQPGEVIMPPAFKKYGERIYNMEVKKDDVWVVTYAKTGTTWTQSAIWAILNDGDFSRLGNKPLLDYWYFIEFTSLIEKGIEHLARSSLWMKMKMWYLKWMIGDQFEAALKAKDGRLIKTHLPFSMLPPNLTDTAKVVYVCRNPLDTCVSYYHHHRLMLALDFEGNFADFFDYFIKDLVLQAPFWPHIIQGWERRNHPNVLFMFYEDMKKDFPGALKKLADFLGKSLTEEQIHNIAEQLKIENMKKNPNLNQESAKKFGVMRSNENFIRKGAVGDWKNYFNTEMENRMKEWMEKNREGCDLKFPTEE